MLYFVDINFLNHICPHISRWPRGLMDKASDFESEDCEFESRRGRRILGATDKIRDS